MRFELYGGIAEGLIKNRSTWRRFPPLPGTDTLWFHAASAGELEILIPLIEAAIAAAKPVCVSIFSPSAEAWLGKLPEGVHYRGFSPSEKEWIDAFQYFGVKEVITSKYEAWPGLWVAARKINAPVSVVCAQPRSSLRWAKRLLGWFGIPLPRLRFFVLDDSSIPELKKIFPDSECLPSVDPRWLRVFQRAQKSTEHSKLNRWKADHAEAEKPYWVIGSAWPEDMAMLDESIRDYPGSVWVVPHSLKQKPDPKIYQPHANCILVDEMGMLAELYSIADRAWVGGGYGKGIHSTLEPSVFGIPVACGPKNVDHFHETRELRASGQLTVCESAEKVREWAIRPSQKFENSLKLKLKKIDDLIGSILR